MYAIEPMMIEGKPSNTSPRRLRCVLIASALLPLAIFALCALHGHFHVGLNDFWGIRYYAENIDWNNRESLYNGFFPIGYPLLIKLFSLESVVVASHVINFILAALLISTTAALVASRYGVAGAALTALLALFHPRIFMYALIPGPDIGSAAFTSAAIFLLWRRILAGREEGRTRRDLIYAGLLLGFASLWRHHAVLSSISIILFYYLTVGRNAESAEKNSTARKTLPGRYALPAAFLLVCAIQVVVNVVSGHGAFETAQKFNVYRFVFDFNWWHPPERIDMSMLEILLARPVALIKAYIPFLLAVTAFGIPAACCIIISRNRAVTSYAVFAAGSILLYAIPAGLGGSDRAPLVITPLSVATLAICILEAYRRLSTPAFLSRPHRRSAAAVLLCLGALYAGSWLYRDVSAVRMMRSRNETFRTVENVLLARGLTDPGQAFTDDFDLYLPGTPPYRPLHNGGWVRFSLYSFAERYPGMPTESVHAFSGACRDRDIRFLVLTDRSSNLADFLHRLYLAERDDSRILGSFMAEAGRYKIFDTRRRHSNEQSIDSPSENPLHE